VVKVLRDLLHAILHRTNYHIRLEAAARLDIPLGKLDHGVAELVLDLLVNVDALAQHADLARVEESERGNLGETRLNVHVVTHTMAASVPPSSST
jgi:hypothetical protein